jgi:hypothetical protein
MTWWHGHPAEATCIGLAFGYGDFLGGRFIGARIGGLLDAHLIGRDVEPGFMSIIAQQFIRARCTVAWDTGTIEGYATPTRETRALGGTRIAGETVGGCELLLACERQDQEYRDDEARHPYSGHRMHGWSSPDRHVGL